MLSIHSYDLVLRSTSAGLVDSWLGSSLRGLVAGKLKTMQCRHEPAERPVYCDGCELARSCAYGNTYEPEAVRDRGGPGGAHDATRPVVLAPYFPLGGRLREGNAIPVRATFVGSAERYADQVFQAVQVGGRESGLGPDRVRFEIDELRSRGKAATLIEEDFSRTPLADSCRLPRVGVGLTAPLFLSARDRQGRRQPVRYPSLADLVAASVRVIGNLFWFFGQRESFELAPLLAAARDCALVEHCYETYDRPRYSSRRRERRQMSGVVGGGVYRDVPLGLIPWLTWGGRLHVGRERVAGAGSWRLVLD